MPIGNNEIHLLRLYDILVYYIISRVIIVNRIVFVLFPLIAEFYIPRGPLQRPHLQVSLTLIEIAQIGRFFRMSLQHGRMI